MTLTNDRVPETQRPLRDAKAVEYVRLDPHHEKAIGRVAFKDGYDEGWSDCTKHFHAEMDAMSKLHEEAIEEERAKQLVMAQRLRELQPHG